MQERQVPRAEHHVPTVRVGILLRLPDGHGRVHQGLPRLRRPQQRDGGGLAPGPEVYHHPSQPRPRTPRYMGGYSSLFCSRGGEEK